MVPSDDQAIDNGLLRRYLLGALPEADAERLHELSVTDDAFAGRVEAIENDLVDAYVRGELSQDDLKQFKSFYLSSPKRREKVQFAEGFLALERRTAGAPAGAFSKKRETASESSPSPRALPDGSTWRVQAVPRFRPQWGLAAACLALLLAGGYLLFQNLELRKQVTEEQAQHVSDQRARDLEMQLAQERSAKEQALKQLEQAHGSRPNLDQLKTVSMLLPPPTRGAGPPPRPAQNGVHALAATHPRRRPTADDFVACRNRPGGFGSTSGDG